MQHVHVLSESGLSKSDYELWPSALITEGNSISNFLCVLLLRFRMYYSSTVRGTWCVSESEMLSLKLSQSIRRVSDWHIDTLFLSSALTELLWVFWEDIRDVLIQLFPYRTDSDTWTLCVGQYQVPIQYQCFKKIKILLLLSFNSCSLLTLYGCYVMD